MQKSTWPPGADGDVFRRLERSGFDFSKTHVVDFNIDTTHWPPHPDLIVAVEGRFPGARMVEPELGHGYIEFRVEDFVTYDLVISVQREASELAAPFGGICESWGVWQQ